MFLKIEPATVGHILHDGFMDYTIRCLVKANHKTAGAISTRNSPGGLQDYLDG